MQHATIALIPNLANMCCSFPPARAAISLKPLVASRVIIHPQVDPVWLSQARVVLPSPFPGLLLRFRAVVFPLRLLMLCVLRELTAPRRCKTIFHSLIQ